MDGTVNCANLDEGRPALAGTATAATAFSTTGGTTTAALDLDETGAGLGLTDLVETGMGAGLAEARVLGIGWETAFVAGFPDGTAALAATFSTVATGLAALEIALATGFESGMDAGFGSSLGAAFVETEDLATGFAGA